MIIEIFSDASVNLQTGDAGFAFWVSSYQTEYQEAGFMRAKDSGIAEVYSINRAVESLLSRELCPLERVDIYTDSTEAIHRMKDTRCYLFYNLMELVVKNGMRPKQIFELIKFHHVKAHTRSEDNVFFKNRWADMMSKQHRVMKTEFKATIFDNSDILL